MKFISTLEVKIDGSLKVKGCTLIITSSEASTHSKDETKDESKFLLITSQSERMTILEIEVEPTEAPKTLEDGGQAIVDELKKLNLGMKEDPHHIYVNTTLLPEEEKRYFIYSLNIRMYLHGVTRKSLL